MSDGTRGGSAGQASGGRPPHPATVAQPKAPHPATVAQLKARHPATVVQPKAPHPATAAQLKAPHAATVVQPKARHPATVAQRMEVLADWFCFRCGITQRAASKEDLPLKGCKGNVKTSHQWQPGTGKKAPKKGVIEFIEVIEVRKPPARFNEARTWDELRVLIAPWAGFALASVQEGEQRVFSNVSVTAEKAIAAVELAASRKAKQARKYAVDEEVDSGNPLTHTGLLRATALNADGGLLFTFYGAAANVYIDSKTRDVSWLRDKENPKNNGGSCHTEQMCMSRLHDHLLGPFEGAPLAAVTLEWWTELVMCEQWCVPAMGLFVEHWGRLNVRVGWELGRL